MSMCPLGCVLCECVFALSVLLYSCVLMPVCSYVRVSAIQALCVSGSSFACPAGVLASTSRRVRSVCPRESSSGGAGREGEVGVSPLLHPPTPCPPPPLPQSRDRTLFRVAIRHLFSNLISSELYFPSLRKIIFHRSRSRPLPRTARHRRRLHISARRAGPGGREGGRRAARGGARGGGGGGGGRAGGGRGGSTGGGGGEKAGGRPRCPGPTRAPRPASRAAAHPQLGPQLPASRSLCVSVSCLSASPCLCSAPSLCLWLSLCVGSPSVPVSQ